MLEKLYDIINLFLPVLTFIIMFTTFFTAYRINKLQTNEIKRKYKPYIIITDLSMYQKYIHSFIVSEKLPGYEKQLLNKKKKVYIDYTTKSLISKSEDISEDISDQKTVFFDKKSDCLFLNLLDNEDDIFIDWCETIIELKNIGYQLSSYTINGVNIKYNSGKGNIILYGDNIKHQKLLDFGDVMYLELSTVANNIAQTLCDFEKQSNKLSNKKDKFDLLDAPIGNNFLNYNTLEIYVTLYNTMDMAYNYIIFIEVQDGIIITKTKFSKIKLPIKNFYNIFRK